MKTKLSFPAFIAKHRGTLLATIQKKRKDKSELSDEQIKGCVREDADLRAWAKSLGVSC